MPPRFESIAAHLRLCVTPQHKFGTDAFLLSDFARPRKTDLACDLCAGCGIVGALWFRSPEAAPAKVYAVELQPEAVAQMHCSINEGGLPADRFVPVCADLCELSALTAVLPAGRLGLVTCNPPYQAAGHGILSETESDRLARHETGCTLADVCAAAARLLRFGGRLCVCHRPERLADIICAMRDAGLEPKRLRMVQQRIDSCPWLVLVEGRQGGKPSMVVEPPLIVEGPEGFSPEMLRIYRKEKNLPKRGRG